MFTNGTRPTATSVISALWTSSATATSIQAAKQTLREAIDGHAPLASYGIDPDAGRDALKDTRERLEDILAAYGGTEDEEHIGTDEEYPPEEDDDAWDL